MAEVGPDGAGMERAMRLLERSHDDSRIRDALGRRAHLVTDAITGLPVEHYVYRLDCGHLVVIYTTPLPTVQRHIYCSECSPARERFIAELLVEAPDPGPLARTEIGCAVCAEAVRTRSAVPVTHRHGQL